MPYEAEIQGVRETLANWLYTLVAPDFPTLEVLSEWPDGQDLPEVAIYVAATGEADVSPHVPRPVSVTPTTGANGIVTYAYGYAEEIQLELDCWANNKPKRDALALAVRRALGRSPQATTGGSSNWPRLSRPMYLSLPVPALYGAIFTYRFSSVPHVDESSGRAEKNEWRSHFRGTADGPLWEQDTMALMKRAHLVGGLGPAAVKQPIAAARPAVQTLTIVTPRTASIAVGASKQLQALAVYDDGNADDVTATATWSSTAPAIATVSAGLVTAQSAGSSSVSATFGAHVASSAVSVN